MTNGTLLRVIRRKDRNSFCLPLTHFSEDMEKRQKIDDEIRSRQVSSLCGCIRIRYMEIKLHTHAMLQCTLKTVRQFRDHAL